MFWQIH